MPDVHHHHGVHAHAHPHGGHDHTHPQPDDLARINLRDFEHDVAAAADAAEAAVAAGYANPDGSPIFRNLHDLARTAHDGVQVHGANAFGTALLTNGQLGADMLWVPPEAQFPIHTHPGDHLLLCLHGTGTISIGARTYRVGPGDFYMVPGMVPHAVGAAMQGHLLVAIGSPHKPVDSPDRMAPTDWDGNAVEAPIFDVPDAES